jgi:hypothetical protein
MVTAFAKRGLQAEASYVIFPDQPPAPDQLKAMATRDGFDGVAATHFVGARQHTYVESYPGWGWGWYRPWAWGPWYGPGYVESDVRADFQTDVYTVDATGGKLIWSGVTRSLDPGSTKGVTDDISQVLVPQLIKEGILTGGHS